MDKNEYKEKFLELQNRGKYKAEEYIYPRTLNVLKFKEKRNFKERRVVEKELLEYDDNFYYCEKFDGQNFSFRKENGQIFLRGRTVRTDLENFTILKENSIQLLRENLILTDGDELYFELMDNGIVIPFLFVSKNLYLPGMPPKYNKEGMNFISIDKLFIKKYPIFHEIRWGFLNYGKIKEILLNRKKSELGGKIEGFILRKENQCFKMFRKELL